MSELEIYKLSETVRELKEIVKAQQERPNDQDVKQTRHTIKTWTPRFCPDGDCSDAEAEAKGWKNEADCSDCGLHYGTVEVAQKVARCPNCGGKHYVRTD